MGFRFRKSIKILPGIRINVSNKGVNSVSVGGRGAKMNIGKKGIRNTVGIPGSGLSYSSYSPYSNKRKGRKFMNDNLDSYGHDEPRSVGFLLGCGIFLFPMIFAWFTLRLVYPKTRLYHQSKNNQFCLAIMYYFKCLVK